MKVFSTIVKLILLSAVMTVATTSCDSDIDPVYVLSGDSMELMGGPNEVILTPDNPQALALTVYWSGDGRLALSDTLLQAPVNVAEITIQFSKDEHFTAPLNIAVDKNIHSRQFLCEELNSLLDRLGYEANEKAPLWIRMRSALAANIAPEYSNVMEVLVQSYRIELVLAQVLDKDWKNTSMTLASPAEDGIYKGFMGVNGWENWWLREANNVMWGNLGEEGKTFYASSEDSHWNFWFPNPSGCYYTTVNTVEGWWSALHVASLSVSGDVTGEMAYNKQSNQWTLPVNLATQSTLTISVSGKGSLYNRETTDIGPAIEQTVAFGGNSQNLLFGESADNISVTMPAGENLLVLDLSNPLQFTIGIGEDVPQPEVSQYLYFSGITNWEGFDDYLTLYDEAGLCYGGAHWIDSEWGYRAYTEQAWEPAYNAADGSTDLSGTLILAESKDNIPAPAQGLYVMDFNMKSLTYELTQVQTVTFTKLILTHLNKSVSMKIASILSIVALIASMATNGCSEDGPVTNPRQEEPQKVVKEEGFARGADVSWLTQMEAEGLKFYTPDENRQEMECMELLRDYCGVNSIRLRVWVNPKDGWNNMNDVIVKAKRAERLGLRTMIDFHFSDTWADPGHQEMPEAWKELSFDDLKIALSEHVKSVLTALKAVGVTPEWVQVGNETTPGMMLPVGSVDNPEQLTALNNAGYDAVKAICPDAKVIVHLDAGNDQWVYNRMFDILQANGGKYDMIGMSLYPYWAEQEGKTGGWLKVADDCIANIKHVKQKYNKPVMICEIGMPYDQAEACKQLITKMMQADVEGIFYWEPQAPNGYNDGYNLGCFDNNAPTIALDAFKIQ